MLLILISGLAMAGAAVVLLGRAVVMPRARTADNLRSIGAYGYVGTGPADDTSAAAGPLRHLGSRIGALLGNRLGEASEERLRTRLLSAGLYKTHPRDFAGYRVLSALAVGAVFWWFAGVWGFSFLTGAAAVAFGGAAGWYVPILLLRSRAQRRLEQIDHDLPELIDLLVVTVEAGLGFNGSVQMAAERLEGPLGDELRLALQEQRMGLSPQEALRNMLARSDTPMMRSFIRTTLQGEALGVSIGEIMRNLAREMRTRRRQAAEERAQKAPTKLLFPLIFLIFPGMFVVILGPAGFAVLDAF